MVRNFTQEVTLDARPDRIDFRDRDYRPPLVSLPECFPSEVEIRDFLPLYTKMKRILDQGPDGACTGFGLAAVVNYVIWDRWVRKAYTELGEGEEIDFSDAPRLVSPWMLYDNARMYDEWEGEDYSGSSCRGAMKGWHKHGVCDELRWFRDKPRRAGQPPQYRRPTEDWKQDAGKRPLGAYFRVDVRSIADMQAAIREVRAVFCSAKVHSGWNIDENSPGPKIAGLKLPRIKQGGTPTGGHAFALMGYTSEGFIVQNSWGPDWGNMGFGLLTYADWVENGHDAWVAALAAPMQVGKAPEAPAGRTHQSLQVGTEAQATSPAHAKAAVKPWSMDKTLSHSVILGNDGKLLRRLADVADGTDSLRKVAEELPQAAIDKGAKHVAVYVHGGLNSEDAALARAMRLGPWIEANGIYPIFLVWRTSLSESLAGIGVDFVQDFLAERDHQRSKGIGDAIDRALQRMQNKFDRAFEAAAEKVIGKAVWSQMKQNAAAASIKAGGARQLSKALGRLLKANPGAKLHLIGHSAGSLQLGHMLRDLPGKGVDSVHLYAPACTMAFANRQFGKALNQKVVPKGRMFVDLLSVDREEADTVGPYGKSLLWLVSRAFEDPRKTPLLGLALAWPSLVDHASSDFDPERFFHPDHVSELTDWDASVRKHKVETNVLDEEEVTTRQDAKGNPLQRIKAVHGSFDNDVEVVSRTVRRILKLSPDTPLHRQILDLSNF